MSSHLQPKQHVVKVWGQEEVFANNDRYCGKFLVIKPGYRCSLHSHLVKHETFVPIAGKVLIEYKEVEDGPLEQVVLDAARREPFEVPPGLWHRFQSADGQPAVLVEVSTQHKDEDVVRLEESGPLPEKE